ncbi:hypothetical protein Hanom_Chr10g00922221 [Helianthus anomalus]
MVRYHQQQCGPMDNAMVYQNSFFQISYRNLNVHHLHFLKVSSRQQISSNAS